MLLIMLPRSANIVMAGKAESEGHHISFYDFMKVIPSHPCTNTPGTYTWRC